MKINSTLCLSIFYGIIFLSTGVQSQSFEQIYSEDINCINPSWSFDSRTFSVEKVSTETKKYKLLLGRVSGTGIGKSMVPIFKTKKQRGKKKKKKRERNAGWIIEDKRFTSLVVVKGENANIMKQADIPNKIDEISRDQIKVKPPSLGKGKKETSVFNRTKKKYRTKLLNGQPRYFTPIKDEDFYFITLASHNTILRSDIFEEEIQLINYT